MERIAYRCCMSAEKADQEEQIKRKIFEKVSQRMGELGFNHLRKSCLCAELNPDVIVISGDQSFLFEPQNLRVIEWLHRYLGLNNLRIRESIRVHPSKCQTITRELKAAGFEVAC